MKDWIIKHKKQLCVIGSVVLAAILVFIIVFGIKGCSKVKEEPYKTPSAAESESEQSSKDRETSEQPSTSEQSESSSSGGAETSSSSPQKQPAQTPSQKPSSPATQQPSKYHTAWGTRPHEFEEAFSGPVVNPIKEGLFGWFHVDHYGNWWHDWQEHSNGHGKMIFYDPVFFGNALYCGNGHWINDGIFGYYWGEYDYPITAHTGQIPFDPSNATLAEHPSDMLAANGGTIENIYMLLYLNPTCHTIEELVSHSQPTYNMDGSILFSALDVKTVNAYGLYEMTSYDKWEPKSKYIAP